MERTLTGPAPALRLPPGATDTQMHCYLPGFPGAPGALPVPEGDASPDAYRQVMGWLGIERVVVTLGHAATVMQEAIARESFTKMTIEFVWCEASWKRGHASNILAARSMSLAASRSSDLAAHAGSARHRAEPSHRAARTQGAAGRAGRRRR